MALRYFLLFSVICLLFGCSDGPEKPDHLIPEESYTNLLVELQLVRSYSERMNSDSLTVDSLTAGVFNKYGITNEQFQQSHHYYQQFPKEQLERIDKAIENLKKDQAVETAVIPADSLDQEQFNYFYYEFQERDSLNPLIIRPDKKLPPTLPSIYIYRHRK